MMFWIAESLRIVWVFLRLVQELFHLLPQEYTHRSEDPEPVALLYCDDLDRRADLLDWVGFCPAALLP